MVFTPLPQFHKYPWFLGISTPAPLPHDQRVDLWEKETWQRGCPRCSGTRPLPWLFLTIFPGRPGSRQSYLHRGLRSLCRSISPGHTVFHTSSGLGEDGEGQGLVLNFKMEHGVLLPTAKTSRKHFSIHTAPGRVVRESRWLGP